MSVNKDISANNISYFLRNKKAIIFDMDGVLVDTVKLHETAFLESLNSIGEVFDYKNYTGMRTDEAFRNFLGNENTIKYLTEKKQEKARLRIENASLYPYADRLLKYLKSKGKKLALATSASRKGAYFILENLDIKKYFDVVVTGEDVESAKPSPKIYERVLSSLNSKKEEVIVIEDAPSGIKASKSAKLITLAILNTYKESDLFEADFIIKDIRSLYNILNHSFSSTYPKKELDEFEKVISVIPAAGKGTRLSFDKPKVLFPITNKTVLEILYEKLKPLSSQIILVTNPEGEFIIKEFVREKNLEIEVLTIENSMGTADSILTAKKYLNSSKNVLVIWGDQVGIKKESLEKIIRLHIEENGTLSLPTIIKSNPYIHLERDEKGVITKVLRKRLNDSMPLIGENDSGVFIGNKDFVFSCLEKMKEKYLINRSEQELDFLSAIPLLATEGKIITSPCVSEEETIGLNNLEEAKFHENLMKTRYCQDGMI